MSDQQPNNALHGVTLKAIVEDLVARRGWDDLAARIKIRCFASDPSLNSTLKFLRKTDWARNKVEQLYLQDQRALERKRERNKARAARRAYAAEQEAENDDAAEPDLATPSSRD